MKVAFLLLLFVVPLAAQERASDTDNPMAVLKEALDHVLLDAKLPFTDEQERAIVLMMEERRRASEDLFGGLMDFRSGPTNGQDADRLRSAIDWMRDEFIKRLADYLTPEQYDVWIRSGQALTLASPAKTDAVNAKPKPPSQTQFVRINNNAFTAEDPGYRFAPGGFGGGGAPETEVIQRGGAGAFHGRAQFLFKDDALNARNAFAANKPPYQERQLSFDVGGPIVRGRLTTSVGGFQNRAENVDTINATLPEGPFALGITRPSIGKNINTRSTYQLSDGHSVSATGRYNTDEHRNQNVGGFNMPDRASTQTNSSWNLGVRTFSSISAVTVFESRFGINNFRSDTTPVSDAVKISVPDAFGSGGAQNRGTNKDRSYEFGVLHTRLGEKLTLKTGVEGQYRRERSFSLNNFGGSYTFANLAGYIAGTPLSYRVQRGDPNIVTTQLEGALFAQNDIKVTPRLTVMLGARYDLQTNLRDYDNVAPRAAFAYALGKATVIRGGGGLFYHRLSTQTLESQRRLDGSRQFELIIDYPSFPDPFQAGALRQTYPSIRVTPPGLTAPHNAVGMVSVERTFRATLFVTAMYDWYREYHRYRLRNLNAPYDAALPVRQSCTPATPAADCIRPDPAAGNVLSLEGTGGEARRTLRLSMRERFSIFSVSANYWFQHIEADVSPCTCDIPTDNYNLRSDWSRAFFPRHNLNTTINAALPLGVFVTSSMSTNSGRFYTITTGYDDNRDTQINDRPAGAGRNTAHGPKYLNFNFNVSKAVFFGGSTEATAGAANLNAFLNITNAFNRIHYGVPSGVQASSNFGKSTSASDPRELEIGLRFQF